MLDTHDRIVYSRVMSNINVTNRCTGEQSSWINKLRYVRHADTRGHGFLVLYTTKGATRAYLVPSWVPGLIAAAKSKGRAFNLLVRGRFPSVAVIDEIVETAGGAHV